MNVQLPNGVDQQSEDSGIIDTAKCKEIDGNNLDKGDSCKEKVYQKKDLGKSDSSSGSSGIESVEYEVVLGESQNDGLCEAEVKELQLVHDRDPEGMYTVKGLIFMGVPIFVVFLEISIHECQYQYLK